MSKPNKVTEIQEIAAELSQTERGQEACKDLVRFITSGALLLDEDEWGHVLVLLARARGGMANTTIQALQDATTNE